MTCGRNDVAVVVLAAGKGTRMESAKAKVLHEILGTPMINYVVQTSMDVVGRNVWVVIGHQADKVRTIVSNQYDVRFVYQNEQMGTGHAVSCAMPHLEVCIKDVVVLCGDVPLITRRTIQDLIFEHRTDKNDVTVLSVELDDPAGYGRMLVVDGQVAGIVEEADASSEQKKIQTVNAGVYCIDRAFLEYSLSKISADNSQEELYLTDIVKIAYAEDKRIGMVLSKNNDEVKGVNTQMDLLSAQNLMQSRVSEKS